MFANMQRKVSKYFLKASKYALKHPLKGEVNLEQAMRAQRESSGIDILFL
jgi:hypothetical protein